MKSSYLNIFPLLLLMSLFYFASCNKEKIIDDGAPANPFDNVDYGGNVDSTSPPDPNSITGIHRNILSPKCANPSCHDGSFEPDYRTVMSSYNTLVYHKVVKNSQDSSFKYRVLPYDTSKSWLHERLTTDNATLGRMPLYSNPLTSQEMGNINTWIMNGAKDMFGNPAVKPDTRPNVVAFLAVDSVYNRLDTVRIGGLYYNPFIAPSNMNMRIIFLVEDDATDIENMQVNKMKLSDDKNNYASATTYQAYYLLLAPYKFWIVDINTSMFTPGTIHYFRYYINDGFHSGDTEFPTTPHADAYKTYFSFYVQ